MSHQYKMLIKGRKAYLGREKIKDRNDCTVISVAIACRVDYETAHKVMARCGRKPGHGAGREVYLKAVSMLGRWAYHVVDKYEAKEDREFTSRTVRTLERELYKKARGRRFMIRVYGHLLAFNGVNICDWTKGRHHHVKEIWEVQDEMAR